MTCCDYTVRSLLSPYTLTAGVKAFDRKSRRILTPPATGGGVPLAAVPGNGFSRVALCDWLCKNTKRTAHSHVAVGSQ